MFLPEAMAWSRPPKPMSYAQPFGQGLGFSCVDAGQLVAQSFDIGALVVDFDVGRLRIAQNLVCQFADFVL